VALDAQAICGDFRAHTGDTAAFPRPATRISAGIRRIEYEATTLTTARRGYKANFLRVLGQRPGLIVDLRIATTGLGRSTTASIPAAVHRESVEFDALRLKTCASLVGNDTARNRKA
jgi:hypothetical protein